MASTQKELRQIIREAERQGWRVEHRKHIHFYAPDGKNIVIAPSTPSDSRWKQNLIADLRRYGFRWNR